MSKELPWNAARVYIYGHKDKTVEVKLVVEGYDTWTTDMWDYEAIQSLARIVDEDYTNYFWLDDWTVEEVEEQFETYGRVTL